LLTKKKKAWFFLLCGERPKINKLIFLLVFRRFISEPHQHMVCHQSEGPDTPALFYCLQITRLTRCLTSFTPPGVAAEAKSINYAYQRLLPGDKH
jgi:hypothetical protein